LKISNVFFQLRVGSGMKYSASPIAMTQILVNRNIDPYGLDYREGPTFALPAVKIRSILIGDIIHCQKR
jgi:hypothetical protein